MTYQDFVKSRKFADDLSQVIRDESLVGQPGFYYLDSYFIQLITENDGQGDLVWWTLASNRDARFATLSEAEEWLWDNHVKDEVEASQTRTTAYRVRVSDIERAFVACESLRNFVETLLEDDEWLPEHRAQARKLVEKYADIWLEADL